jgi:hypothetical protein
VHTDIVVETGTLPSATLARKIDALSVNRLQLAISYDVCSRSELVVGSPSKDPYISFAGMQECVECRSVAYTSLPENPLNDLSQLNSRSAPFLKRDIPAKLHLHGGADKITFKKEINMRKTEQKHNGRCALAARSDHYDELDLL